MTSKQTSRLGSAPEEGVKAPVVAASTENLDLEGLPEVDGVQTVAGDRVLVMLQTDSSENGIYNAAAGTWSRSTDFNANNDVINGQLVVDANTSQVWSVVISDDFTMDSSDISFTYTGLSSTEIIIIALALNVQYSEVIYSTDTTTELDDVLYIYSAAQGLTYEAPELSSTGETITSLTVDQLITSADTYTLIAYDPCGTLKTIALSLGILESEVIYSTDTTTALDDVLYIYNASTQIAYVKPSGVGTGEVITSLSDGTLTTSGGSYHISAYEPLDVITGIARSLNVLTSEVIYSTNTVDPVPALIYASDQQKTFSVPAEAIGKTIVSVVGSTLNTVEAGGPYQLTPAQASTFVTVQEMKLLAGGFVEVGSKLSTGFTTWKVTDKVTNWPLAGSSLYAKPLNGLCFLDYGCAGDYFLDGENINPTPTDDSELIQFALDDMPKDASITGSNHGFYHSATIKIDTFKKVSDVLFKQSDSATSYAVWFGDSSNDVPDNYYGQNLKINNVKVFPNETADVVVRFRGLRYCEFNGLNIEPIEDPSGVTTHTTWTLMDAVLGTKFDNCMLQPKDSTTKIMEMGLMRNLLDTANAGNGLGSTSTTFSNCALRRGSTLGRILGDGILFDEWTVFEFVETGFEITTTGSLINFSQCYFEEIEKWGVYAKGIDSRTPSTSVGVRSCKVQMGATNNGSQPDYAFVKATHAYDVELDGNIFQGKAQTRIVEVLTGDNSMTDGKISINTNYGQRPRKTATSLKTGVAVVSSGSSVATITTTDHGLVTGDVVDVESNSLLDPINDTSLILPNRVITVIDVDTFTYATVGEATSSVSATITYSVYGTGVNCLANMDAPSSLISTVGNVRRFGSDLYRFSDCETEFVTFTLTATAAIGDSVMLNNGQSSWSADSISFIKSVRYIDNAGVDSTRYALLRYGGERYTEHQIADVNQEGSSFASSIKYIAPYRIEPGEPLICEATTNDGTYPRQVTMIVEVAKTGLTYLSDQ